MIDQASEILKSALRKKVIQKKLNAFSSKFIELRQNGFYYDDLDEINADMLAFAQKFQMHFTPVNQKDFNDLSRLSMGMRAYLDKDDSDED